MRILLDAEPFNNPKANSNLLKGYFIIKEQRARLLQPTAHKIEQGAIVIEFKPQKISLYYLSIAAEIITEIDDLLTNLDFSEELKKLNESENN